MYLSILHREMSTCEYACFFVWVQLVNWKLCMVGNAHQQLRARRALSLFNNVPFRTRMVLSLYKVCGDSALLVLNRTWLNSINTLLLLNQQYKVTCPKSYFWGQAVYTKNAHHGLRELSSENTSGPRIEKYSPLDSRLFTHRQKHLNKYGR